MLVTCTLYLYCYLPTSSIGTLHSEKYRAVLCTQVYCLAGNTLPCLLPILYLLRQTLQCILPRTRILTSGKLTYPSSPSAKLFNRWKRSRAISAALARVTRILKAFGALDQHPTNTPSAPTSILLLRTKSFPRLPPQLPRQSLLPCDCSFGLLDQLSVDCGLVELRLPRPSAPSIVATWRPKHCDRKSIRSLRITKSKSPR